MKILMEQSYFQFEQKYYKQVEGLAYGLPKLANTC
jgi:hypothetical protein